MPARRVRERFSVAVILLAALGLLPASCRGSSSPAPSTSGPSPSDRSDQSSQAGERSPSASHGGLAVQDIRETPVQVIPLLGPASERFAELSGLAWHGDQLILLPQYPDRLEPRNDGALYAIPEAALLAVVTGQSTDPITPRAIEFIAPDLASRAPGMEGFEAIAFHGDRVFMTLEANLGDRMTGYLVAGTIAADHSRVVLDTDNVVEIPAQASVSNASEESLLVTDDEVITIYEANGANINRSPRVHVFDHSLRPLGTRPFPTIEYRVIDATALDGDNRFWVMNYFFAGDRRLYNPAPDAIAAAHGKGASHGASETVERLLLLEYRPSGIVRIDRPPVQLQLIDAGRNWEGLVRWQDHGFLLTTDMFPDTLLGFVPVE